MNYMNNMNISSILDLSFDFMHTSKNSGSNVQLVREHYIQARKRNVDVNPRDNDALLGLNMYAC